MKVDYLKQLSFELIKYKEYLKQRKDEIESGKNNYSLMNSLLSTHDEVRLHSRFIYSMINPHGFHFQNTLFLEKFIYCINPEILNLLDLSSLEVVKEWNNIDLLITDGKNFIIIENKLHAADQNNQIARYVKHISKKANMSEQDINQNINIIVVYLSIPGKSPSKKSLGDYKLSNNNDKLVSQNQCFDIYLISYKKNIPQWISLCLDEIEYLPNITNAFIEYKHIINMINKSTNPNHVSSFSESILNRSHEELNTYLQFSAEIVNNFHKIWAELIINTIYSIEGFENLIIEGANNILSRNEYSDSEMINITSRWLAEKRNCLKGFGVHFSNKNKNKKYMFLFATKVLYAGEYIDNQKELYDQENGQRSINGLFNCQDFARIIRIPHKAPTVCQEIKTRIEYLINQP